MIQGGIEAGNQLLEFHHLVFIEISIHHIVINSNSSRLSVNELLLNSNGGISGRVVGGIVANENEFPWMVISNCFSLPLFYIDLMVFWAVYRCLCKETVSLDARIFALVRF